MMCNGQKYPFQQTAKFDMIVFGSKDKGKVMFECELDKQDQRLKLIKVEMKTKTENYQLI